jgi:translocator protein
MRLRPNYILIPLVTIAVAILGRIFSDASSVWYTDTLIKPDLTPPDWVFPIVWAVIFICTTLSAIILYNKGQEDKKFLWLFHRENMSCEYWRIIALFLVNIVLNVSWTYLFFQQQNPELAFYDILFLEITNFLLIILAFDKSRKATLLLLPYTLWIAFALYLNWQIVILN